MQSASKELDEIKRRIEEAKSQREKLDGQIEELMQELSRRSGLSRFRRAQEKIHELETRKHGLAARIKVLEECLVKSEDHSQAG